MTTKDHGNGWPEKPNGSPDPMGTDETATVLRQDQSCHPPAPHHQMANRVRCEDESKSAQCGDQVWSRSGQMEFFLKDRMRKEQHDVRQGTTPSLPTITLEDFAAEHAHITQGQVASRTLRDQMRALKLLIQQVGGPIRLGEVSPRHAESFIASRLRRKLAPATVNKDIRTLKRVFNLAIQPRGYLPQGSNPFRNVKPRKYAEKPKRFVSPAEFGALMNATENNWWRALLTVAYATGLRRGEILNLTWNDIDFEGHCVRVSPKTNTDQLLEWEPKDHECRIIPAPHQVMRLLMDLRAESPDECPYPFLGKRRWLHILRQRREGSWRDDKALVNNVDRKFRALRTNAKVVHCTLHDLRQSCITHWACELPAHVVQKLAGHSDIKTTQKYYLIVRQEDLERARNVTSRVLGNDQIRPASKAHPVAANLISQKVEGGS